MPLKTASNLQMMSREILSDGSVTLAAETKAGGGVVGADDFALKPSQH